MSTSFTSICTIATEALHGATSNVSWELLRSTCTTLNELEKAPRGNIVKEATDSGSVSAVEYGVDLGYNIPKNAILRAIASGNHDCAVRLLEIDHDYSTEKVIATAAAAGWIDVMEMAYNGYPYVNLHPAWIAAAKANQLPAIKWLHAKKKSIPVGIVCTAAEYMSPNVIAWALKNGARVYPQVYTYIALNWNNDAVPLDKMMKLFRMVYNFALDQNSGLPCSRTFAVAHGTGNQQLIDWFAENRPSVALDDEAARASAYYGYVDVLAKCNYACDVSPTAVHGNNVDILEYLTANGHVIDKYTCASLATVSGSADALRWIFEHYPEMAQWSAGADDATSCDHVPILEVYLEYGADVWDKVSFTAGQCLRKRVLRWLRDNNILNIAEVFEGMKHRDERYRMSKKVIKTLLWVEPNPANIPDDVIVEMSIDGIDFGGVIDADRLAQLLDHSELSSSDAPSYSDDEFDALYGEHDVSHLYDSDRYE